MNYELGYGKGIQKIEIPDANLMGVLLPENAAAERSEDQEVLRALEEPIESLKLREIIRPGEKIAIVTSDITRPMPTAKVMPALLDELYRGGARPENITLVFAIGSHRHHTDEERKALAGERAWQEIRCVDSDSDDCIHLGTTSGGTPVDITRAVAEADRRICLGNIEYHYFAGYSGGAKAIMPGVSTRAAIQCNHSKMTDPSAVAARLEGNPIREDIEEAGRICGIDFILNVVLDDHKHIVRAFAGHPTEAHRAGCKALDALYGKRIDSLADIVVVSPGGAPKDMNLYQAQKALDNAKHAVKKGGIIILTAACIEGLGESTFEKWMTQAKEPDELIRRIRADFKLGGHKAAAIAMVMQSADVYLVSDLSPELVKSIFFRPFGSAQQALDQAFCELGHDSKVLLMPCGGSTLPLLK